MAATKITGMLRDLNDGKAVNTVTKFYVSLPSEEAHHKSHKRGGMHAMAQRVHPNVIMKIHELVGAGISEVKRALKLYVIKELCPSDLPNGDDRAYFLTNMIYQIYVTRYEKIDHSRSNMILQ